MAPPSGASVIRPVLSAPSRFDHRISGRRPAAQSRPRRAFFLTLSGHERTERESRKRRCWVRLSGGVSTPVPRAPAQSLGRFRRVGTMRSQRGFAGAAPLQCACWAVVAFAWCRRGSGHGATVIALRRRASLPRHQRGWAGDDVEFAAVVARGGEDEQPVQPPAEGVYEPVDDIGERVARRGVRRRHTKPCKAGGHLELWRRVKRGHRQLTRRLERDRGLRPADRSAVGTVVASRSVGI
jgi:hypothetical protein